jgi:exocyst complex component 7
LLFAGERKLCDQVLEGIEESFLDECFVQVTSSSFARLLSFGKAVVKIKKSPEKLFMLLDMYEMTCELEPEVKLINAFLNKIWRLITSCLTWETMTQFDKNKLLG